MAAAFLAIPPLIRGIGLDRFGILTLGWVVVGYFSLFDLGLGRALTKMVADKVASGQGHSLHAVIWSAALLAFLLGTLAAGVMALTSPWIVGHIFTVPDILKHETTDALYLLAVSVPVVTVTSGFRGVLEALQRFDVVNRIRIPMAISVFVGPLLVLPFSRSLVWVFAVLVAGRLVSLLAYLCGVLFILPELRHDIAFQLSELKAAFRFGGWITASNLIVPILAYVDRFVIGAALSLSAVAFYTTPFEAVTKLQAIPGAMAGVMFPAFATSYIQDADRTGVLMQRGVKYVFLLMFPAALILIAFAPEGLELWVGASFARNSSMVLRWLAAGVFVNCLAQIPLALVQGTGYPDRIAKLQAIELPIYLSAIWWATKHYGLNGAAVAWSARVTIDAIVIFLFAYQLLPERRRDAGRLAAAAAVALGLFAIAALLRSIDARALLVACLLTALAAAVWFRILVDDERVAIKSIILRRTNVAA